MSGSKVYAVAQSVPGDCTYFTAGKHYAVDTELTGDLWVSDDDGDPQCIIWQGCMHLNGGNWTRIEGEEPAAKAPADATIAALREIAQRLNSYGMKDGLDHELHQIEQIALNALAGARE